MTAIGSENLEKALKQVSSEDTGEVAKGIGIAAGLEAEAITFYRRQAEKFKGTEMEPFFNFLKGQEMEHREAINELRETLEKKGEWVKPKLPKNERPKVFSKKDWDKEHSEGITAILFALWKEKQAQEFYEEIASRLKNKGAKQFFLALADFEKGHAELLSEYVEDSYYTHELIMG